MGCLLFVIFFSLFSFTVCKNLFYFILIFPWMFLLRIQKFIWLIIFSNFLLKLSFKIIFLFCFSIKFSFSSINTTSCGLTKSCWQQPANCVGINCQTFVSLQVNGSQLIIEMTAQTSGGNKPNINLAFSDDQNMVSDSLGNFLKNTTVLCKYSLPTGRRLHFNVCPYWRFS